MTAGRKPTCRCPLDPKGRPAWCEWCDAPVAGREATPDADFHAECWTHHPEGTPCPSGQETT